LVRNFNDDYGYIDEKTGEVAIECTYKYARRFNNGKAQVTTYQDETKYIDKNEKNIVLRKSYGVIQTEEKDPNDNHVTEKFIQDHWLSNHYQYIDEYPSDGLILVRDYDGNYGYIDEQTGDIAIKCIYKNAKAFKEGFADVVTYQNEKITIDKNGNACLTDQEQEILLKTM
jgi:hypothetical protein